MVILGGSLPIKKNAKWNLGGTDVISTRQGETAGLGLLGETANEVKETRMDTGAGAASAPGHAAPTTLTNTARAEKRSVHVQFMPC